MKKQKIAKVMIAIITLTVSGTAYLLNANVEDGYIFETVKVEKGSVSNTITATGTLEATNTVIVGTQVSGVIEKIYVDFNSKVKRDQLIAEIDKSTLQSSLENAEADLENAQAEFDYQKTNFERVEAFFKKGLSSESDYDLAKYNYRKSAAGLKSAQANLNRAKRNLSYAMIYSPIDGIVLNRAVEEGQTVAASMNTPELFTITNDLSEMQVEADVDEADIGMVKEGQRIEFTVDAFPDETFSGKVTEVRLQPTETQNVITYTVIIKTQNSDLKLKPGMTASITDYVEEVNDVLVLAGKALRFTPDREQMMDYFSSLPENERPEHRTGERESDRTKQTEIPQRTDMPENMKLVWVKDETILKPVRIETGITDGSNIEIISGLNEGDQVVTSMQTDKNVSDIEVVSPDTQKSPFVQERPGRPGGGR